MKHITLLLPFILLVTSGFSVSADETEPASHGLVLLVDFKETGQPSNTFRVTIENRSNKPMRVIPPADIKYPWGKNEWWYCASYQFYLHTADQGRLKYVCHIPRKPAAIPRPVPPKIVTLLPGQSIGALLTLPLPVAVDAENFLEPGEPPRPVSPSWESVDEKDKGKGKAPRSGYVLTVEYSPAEYESAVVRSPVGSGENGENVDPLTLMPPAGEKLTSNALTFGSGK